MHVFVTGATGYIGQVLVPELKAHGHTVLGLARSDASADALKAAGCEVVRGTLYDLEVLKEGAKKADAVIHLSFDHDRAFKGEFEAATKADLDSIEAICSALQGTNKPFVNTSGALSLAGLGRQGLETDRPEPTGFTAGRIVSENYLLDQAKRGIRVMSVRLSPTIHGNKAAGFAQMLIETARAKGESAYVGDGSQQWPSASRDDVAVLYRLALEKGKSGGIYHGVVEEGIKTQDMADFIAKKLNIPVVSKQPEEAMAAIGFLGLVMQLDAPTSNKITREELGWKPATPTLFEDMEKYYFH